MDYGCFVELTPNLSGLTDRREDLQEGDAVSVTIRSIRPERMKIKLQVIEKLPEQAALPTLSYRITDGVLERWVYSPAGYEGAPIATDFTEALWFFPNRLSPPVRSCCRRSHSNGRF